MDYKTLKPYGNFSKKIYHNLRTKIFFLKKNNRTQNTKYQTSGIIQGHYSSTSNYKNPKDSQEENPKETIKTFHTQNPYSVHIDSLPMTLAGRDQLEN